MSRPWIPKQAQLPADPTYNFEAKTNDEGKTVIHGPLIKDLFARHFRKRAFARRFG